MQTVKAGARGTVAAELRRAAPEFADAGCEGPSAQIFDWTREYHKGRWDPLRRLGGRQHLGTVRLDENTLVADAKTLSMAARLAHRLHNIIGDAIDLRHTKWTGANELLSRSSELAAAAVPHSRAGLRPR